MTASPAKVDFSHLEFNLKRLSSDVHSPCYVLHLRDVNVLLDCCIETSMLANFMPSHQLTSPGCSDLPPLQDGGVTGFSAEQVSVGNHVYLNSRPQFSVMNQEEFSSVIWDTIDVILVSNAQSILGLPFICESTNFRGLILTTEPVVKFGKILMEDILDALEQLPSVQPSFDLNGLDSKAKKSSSDISDELFQRHTKVWRQFYTRQTIISTLDRIQMIAYHEPVDIFGLLTISGSSAGFGIGSCNWALTTPTEKVVYISHTSLLYSHVLPFDSSVFADTDVLIIGTVNMLSSAQLEKAVSEFRHIVVQTLARGGHVLVPTNPCGVLFDLIETAVHAKENFKGSILPLFPTDRTDSVGSVAPTSSTTGHQWNPTSSVFPDEHDSANSSATVERAVNPTVGGSSLAGRVARCPVFALSSQINVSLAYANAYGEWLNPEKEALLYTADAPFPFQALIRSGQLVPLKRLHEAPSVKDLGDPHARAGSPALGNAIPTSPLLLGPNVLAGDMLVTGVSSQNPIAGATITGPNTLDSTTTMLALAAPIARWHQSGLTGGIWPGSPCLIFASHPSLRFGPVVHLIRALAYGDLRTNNRTVQAAPPPHHSIILVESGDYIHRTQLMESRESSVRYLQHLVSPYTQPADLSRATVNFSPSGIPTCSLSDTVTVFWLPMEARLGVDELPHLLSRCHIPRLAICLPAEISTHLPEKMVPSSCAVHFIARGQTLHIPMSDSRRMQPVRLSAQLVNRLRPVHLSDPRNDTAVTKTATKVPADPRMKSATGIGSSTDEGSTSVPVGKRPSAKIPVEASDTKRACEESPSPLNRSFLALIDGLLVTRDGTNWLKDPQEVVTSGNRASAGSTRPCTPPLQPPTSGRRTGVDQDRPPVPRQDAHVFVSRTPRIEPRRLIKELTERGVTGAQLAEHHFIVDRVAQRFKSFETGNITDNAKKSQKADYILFPNPNTVIKLSDHESHILTVDEGTRTTIRDSILCCLQQLEAGAKAID
ncbi:hypothetical protein P879_08520 [Paragonimus westermani]|uniref:Metallo-beta-lactamase domain-containing protein n=1 Tax=Paragonimus westermani TaxID=34504 RepID=A0A8T0DBD9_9TREM|nr:hypothetical protein P879_08520 [Paragonimus westermani]